MIMVRSRFIYEESYRKFIETVKDKNCKIHVKKPAALLIIYYFTKCFSGNLLGLKQFAVAVYKDWPNKHNTFKNKFIHLGNFFSQLFAL